MNNITLYPNKFSFKDDEGSFQNLTLENIDKHLWSQVEVHASVTIRTLMEIMKYPGIGFWQHALTEPLLPELFEYYEGQLSKKGNSPFDAIIFHWHGEHWQWKDDSKNHNEEVHIDLDVSGFVENDPNNPLGIYGLTFAPLGDLIDAPIRIDNSFKIWVLGDKYGEEQAPFEFGYRTPTLLELMKAFVYEVTFLGTEKDKKEQLEEMNRRIEDVQSGRAQGCKFNSFEEMREFLKKRIKGEFEEDDEGDDEENLT